MLDSVSLLNFDWDAPVTDEERDRIFDRIAAMVNRWKLELPFMLWLETTAPLANLMGQSAIVMSPFLAPFFSGGVREMQVFVKLLSSSANVRMLVNKLEGAQIDAPRE